MHLVVVTRGGGLWHTIRHLNGSWQPSFGDIKGQEPNDPGHFSGAGSAGVHGEFHFGAITDDGRKWHTIRHAEGNREPFFGDGKGEECNDPRHFAIVRFTGS